MLYITSQVPFRPVQYRLIKAGWAQRRRMPECHCQTSLMRQAQCLHLGDDRQQEGQQVLWQRVSFQEPLAGVQQSAAIAGNSLVIAALQPMLQRRQRPVHRAFIWLRCVCDICCHQWDSPVEQQS